MVPSALDGHGLELSHSSRTMSSVQWTPLSPQVWLDASTTSGTQWSIIDNDVVVTCGWCGVVGEVLELDHLELDQDASWESDRPPVNPSGCIGVSRGGAGHAGSRSAGLDTGWFDAGSRRDDVWLAIC